MSADEIFVSVMVVGFLAVVYFGNRHSKKNPGDGSGRP
jgi:cbb3-type cytochrome oxidase subunit 3